MAKQQQFLNVIDRDEAHRRFHAALELVPLAEEEISIADALGRVTSRDVTAPVDVPSFDRSNFDGFAVQAADTHGASEERPSQITLLPESVPTGHLPQGEVTPGTAMPISTGAMLPRGADAIVMVEHADLSDQPSADSRGQQLVVRKSVAAGFGVSFAGSDIAAGETVLYSGQLLSSRETGVLAAIGCHRVFVWRQVRVAIVSTGDEIIPPGEPMQPPMIYDSNARILADAVRELGAQPIELGIVSDDYQQLHRSVEQGLADADVILLSGGTSKGEGDLCYRIVQQFNDPGIVVHGVALKPGKPICLAVTGGKPVVILPGFPTSAIFTFHEFVAPVIRRLGGFPPQRQGTIGAVLSTKVQSEVGRTEYLLVSLAPQADGPSELDGACGTDEADEVRCEAELQEEEPPQEIAERGSSPTHPQETSPTRYVAYPMGKGSGSVTTFSHADGFVTLDRHEEIVASGSLVDVTLLGRDLRIADLIVIGSHCVGLDCLLSQLQRDGWQTKSLAVGSTAGLQAARRAECDVAGVHLLDETTGQYNQFDAYPEIELLRGYGRMQGVLYRPGDSRFAERTAEQAIAEVKNDANYRMVNRNRGSGTRALIDQHLGGTTPVGYSTQARSHTATAAAVAQGRADWGVAIESVARANGLGFLPLTEEQYDFVIPRSRSDRPAVQAFRQLLQEGCLSRPLRELGFRPAEETDR